MRSAVGPRRATGAERADYRYDLFGQLVAIERVDGDGAPTSAVEYTYDGFGRLVARDDGHGPTYHLLGVDGHRLVDVDAAGACVRVVPAGSVSSASGGSTARSAARWPRRSTAIPSGDRSGGPTALDASTTRAVATPSASGRP